MTKKIPILDTFKQLVSTPNKSKEITSFTFRPKEEIHHWVTIEIPSPNEALGNIFLVVPRYDRVTSHTLNQYDLEWYVYTVFGSAIKFHSETLFDTNGSPYIDKIYSVLIQLNALAWTMHGNLEQHILSNGEIDRSTLY